MTVSLFGFLGNVMIDYNWGTNPVANSIAVSYWLTLRWIVPFPLNYWGAGAVIYFGFFLVSFALLNRDEPHLRNILETSRLASVMLVLFELGVYYFVPDFMDKWEVQAFHGTPLAIFTKWDLLAVALLSTVATQVALSRLKKSARKPRPIGSTLIGAG